MHSDQQAAQQVGITILNTSLCIYYLFHNLISSFVFEYGSIHSRHKVTQTYNRIFVLQGHPSTVSLLLPKPSNIHFTM